MQIWFDHRQLHIARSDFPVSCADFKAISPSKIIDSYSFIKRESHDNDFEYPH